MLKWSLPLVAILSIASVFCAVIVHACSDLSSIQAFLQAPCDHSASQNESRGKTDPDNCDSIRFGMLATQASAIRAERFKLYSISLDHALFVKVSLPDFPPLFWRNHGPPFSRLGASPRLSHVVLRI